MTASDHTFSFYRKPLDTGVFINGLWSYPEWSDQKNTGPPRIKLQQMKTGDSPLLRDALRASTLAKAYDDE